jgi:hypothetical protein
LSKKIDVCHFPKMSDKNKAKCFKKLSVEEKLRIVSWQVETVLLTVIADRLGRHSLSPAVRETLVMMWTHDISLAYLRHLSNSMPSRMMVVTKNHVDLPKNYSFFCLMEQKRQFSKNAALFLCPNFANFPPFFGYFFKSEVHF